MAKLNYVYGFNKTHAPIGFGSIVQHLEKRYIELYGVRLYKTTRRLLLTNKCTQEMFCKVENRLEQREYSCCAKRVR